MRSHQLLSALSVIILIDVLVVQLDLDRKDLSLPRDGDNPELRSAEGFIVSDGGLTEGKKTRSRVKARPS